MKRTKLCDRVLPQYTKGEEIFNMTSHIVGAVLGVVATVLCIVMSAIHKNVYGIIGGAIYGFTMTLLYVISSVYHGLNANRKSKKVLQILDHCSIFILIAGSYTPITLCNIMSINSRSAWWIFGIIWGATIIGIILNSIDLQSTKIFSMICYLLMGWCIVFKFNILLQGMERNGIILLVAGGIAYTIGAIFYGLGKKKKYFHSIFHLFIVLGSLLQFLCILLYTM